ncbi:MAG: Prolipoprotein diacylglyceryl transferase [Candidatus Gottesmanbacteria bacterium GW2011_GWA2_47_9]|uniref:Prolipoprotein diacylglyceryl transferase n=3 Tax=Candidatus Gottesmaniibacteriota TaxID=1752720 RepID=A0A0G1WYU3_9BACT|nr:MAG: Prolipoprotein diacylglyceryl transferase [Candidatus Gottesmanbacteria bacterium GW2011_GWA2_47_9]KKU95473.1 MAG: Prolipoprotein diacylglyceryl transferase [Candidatus Gottesmanbacteria bacterium GW2011_GWA1_48_13]
MFPVLFSIGPVHIYSFSVFLILGWLVFSFVFWRHLRSQAVAEDRIFDLTFYGTLAALAGARIGFAALHPELFGGDLLAVAALWVQPGLSLYGGLLAGLGMLVPMSRAYKVRLGHVLDGFGWAFPAAVLIGKVGSLLDGSEVGIPADIPWAISYVGHVGRRHPIQAYEMLGLACILVLLMIFSRRAAAHKWPYGIIGIWFFMVFAPVMFVLEFLKESGVYLTLRANQWVQVFLFAEALGAFYVRGGGREAMRPVAGSVRRGAGQVLRGIYAKFPKRRSGEHPTSS